MDEKIINDKVDELLKEMEVHFKGAVEKERPLQNELDEKVKKLMDEFDEKEEVIRFQKVKDFSDYIALTISMPFPEELKERIIEALVKECEEDGEMGSKVV